MIGGENNLEIDLVVSWMCSITKLRNERFLIYSYWTCIDAITEFQGEIVSYLLILLWKKETWFHWCLFVTDALTIPSELESALRLRTVQYFITKRPWLGTSLII